MPLHEHRFDGLVVPAGTQLLIPKTSGNVDRGVVIRVRLEPAGLTAERPLVNPILAVRIVAHATLLGAIRARNRGCQHSSLLTIPENLLWDPP